MAVTERMGVSPQRAWLGVALGAVGVLVVGVLALPELVWNRFLWHYFWGPVFADANNAACAVMSPSGPQLLSSTTACTEADASGATVAEPGYTVVSEIGYAVTLVFMLVGVLYLLRYLGVGRDRKLFFALVPFMFFGGALRVVEDANDAAMRAGVDTILTYPTNTLIISPVIYFTVFFVTLAGLVAAVKLAERDTLADWSRPVAAYGTLALVLTTGFLLWFVPSRLVGRIEGIGFYPQMSLVVLALAAVIAVVVYYAAERFAPVINEGTGRIGLVVLFGHAVDGVANVIAADWIHAIGLPETIAYGAKHPVNRFIIDATASVQPAWLSTAVGDSWPFLVVKILAALGVVYVFDETIFEESPRYAILLLIAILAVGLGPGTRDMLRATFGI